MADLAKAYVQIMPSTKGLTGNIQSQIDGTAIGNSVGGKMTGAIKGAIIAAGLGKVLQSSIMEGANLEQNLGGTAAVFGDFASTIQTDAQNAYKNMGMSASEYMGTANKMGSLFQGSGITQQKSLELTSAAMQRAADVASVMGVDTSMAMESITGAAKGNFTMMDNLGVAMNVATLEAYALEKGLNFKWDQATQAEKNTLAMQMFMDRTSQYAGNFAKESEDTISGSIGAIKSSWQNLVGSITLGQDITPALQGLVTGAVNVVKNLVPAIINVITQLPLALVQALAQLAPQIGPAVVTLITTLLTTLVGMIPTLITAGTQLLTGLVTGLLQALPTLIAALPTIITSLITNLLQAIPQIIQCGIDLITALVTALPEIITAIVTALPAIITGIVTTLLQNIPVIIQAGFQLITALITALPEIIAAIIPAIPQIVYGMVNAFTQAIPQIISTGVKLLVSLVKNLNQITSQIVAVVPKVITSLINKFNAFKSRFVTAGKDLLDGLGQGISNAVSGVVAKATSAAKEILGSVKGFFGIHSPSRVFMGLGEYLDEGLAIGITDNLGIVKSAMKDMASASTGSFQSELDVNRNIAYGTQPNTADNEEALTIEELLKRILEYLINLNPIIVLQDGTLVGAIGGLMDAELGKISESRKRGW